MNISAQDLELFWVFNAPRKSIPASRPLVPLYRVGEPLQRGRRHWPTGTQYTHGCNGHELTLFLPEIGPGVLEEKKMGGGNSVATAVPPLMVRPLGFAKWFPGGPPPYGGH